MLCPLHAPGRRGAIWPVPSWLLSDGPFRLSQLGMVCSAAGVSVARLRRRWALLPKNSSAPQPSVDRISKPSPEPKSAVAIAIAAIPADPEALVGATGSGRFPLA
jgi:hypothetical protein